jgi:uncharacterized protein (DUF1684 family)
MPASWTQGDGSAADRAWLADWRRRIATLYTEVRAMAASDPAVALGHWRAVRERMYRDHPQSPVPPDARATFEAAHFEHDPSLRFEAVVEPAPPPAPGAFTFELPTSGAGAERATGAGAERATGAGAERATGAGHDIAALAFTRIGRISIPFAAGPRPLSVYWMTGYAGGLFIPFRDETNGSETYGAGRYLLDAAKGADLGGDPSAGTLVVDFNFAYQPSCAFDPRWACPLAPPENRLDLAVRAGERL